MSGTCPTFDKVRTCPSNILIWMFPVPTTLHSASFPIRTDLPSHGWYVQNHSLLGHMWYVAPESNSQISESCPCPDLAVKTSQRYSSTTPACSNFTLVLAPSDFFPAFFS